MGGFMDFLYPLRVRLRCWINVDGGLCLIVGEIYD